MAVSTTTRWPLRLSWAPTSGSTLPLAAGVSAAGRRLSVLPAFRLPTAPARPCSCGVAMSSVPGVPRLPVPCNTTAVAALRRVLALPATDRLPGPSTSRPPPPSAAASACSRNWPLPPTSSAAGAVWPVVLVSTRLRACTVAVVSADFSASNGVSSVSWVWPTAPNAAVP